MLSDFKADKDNFMVSLYESPIENTISHKTTPHYTYDSLCKIRDYYIDIFDGSNIAGVHLIIGNDLEKGFSKWYKSEQIKKEFGLIVINRDDFFPECSSTVVKEIINDKDETKKEKKNKLKNYLSNSVLKEIENFL